MKYTKIFLAALSSLFLLASCEEPKTLSGDATVGFEAPELEYGLGSEYITVPIVTEGETSIYPIKVTVEVAAYEGDYAAVEDKDFLITSKEILIASKDSKPGLEIKLANPDDKDELRFKLVITSQENAQSIGQKETLVKCAKSELDRVCGSYLFEGTLDGAAVSETWVITNDGSSLIINGAFAAAGGTMKATYDAATRVVTLPLGAANLMGGGTFGSGLGEAYWGPVLFNPDAETLSVKGNLKGQVSETYDKIVWQDMDGLGFYLALFRSSGEYTGYVYQGPYFLNDNTLTKIKR